MSKAIMATGLLVFGALVVAFSCWTDPSGELHASILTFWGETLTAMLLLHGIRRNQNDNQNENHYGK